MDHWNRVTYTGGCLTQVQLTWNCTAKGNKNFGHIKQVSSFTNRDGMLNQGWLYMQYITCKNIFTQQLPDILNYCLSKIFRIPQNMTNIKFKRTI